MRPHSDKLALAFEMLHMQSTEDHDQFFFFFCSYSDHRKEVLHSICLMRGRNRIQEVICYHFPIFTQTQIIKHVFCSKAIGGRFQIAVTNTIIIRRRFLDSEIAT